MSEYQETRLTEVDKLLKKIDIIYTAIKGKDENAVDLTQVKDEYEKLRYEINQKLSEVDTFLSKRDEYKSGDPKDVYEKTKLTAKIEDGLRDIEDKLEKINTVLRSQKGKKKYAKEIANKEEMKNLMEERYNLLKNKNEGLTVDDKKVQDNRNNIERLDALLVERANQEHVERELNEHEKDAMDRWKQEVNEQDIQLQELGRGVKELKGHAKQIGTKIDATGRQIKKTSEIAKGTEKKLETTNAKLKDLLNKLRSGDKICIDIILVLICLGLIAVLYNIIKTKFIDNKSDTTTTSTEKKFLII